MPFESHPEFTTPQFGKKIWRYVGFPKLMWLLHNEHLYFHRVADFPDPFEATLPQAAKDIRGGDTDLFHRESFARDTARKFVFANCWHMNEAESAAMWKLYGDADKTIAIESTVGDLAMSFNSTEKKIHIGEMNYIDFSSSFEEMEDDHREKLENTYIESAPPDLFTPFLTKREEFAHEQEMRAITTKSFDGKTPESGENTSVNIKKLINRIWIAPSTSDWFAQTVEETVCGMSNPCIDREFIKNSKMDDEPLI